MDGVLDPPKGYNTNLCQNPERARELGLEPYMVEGEKDPLGWILANPILNCDDCVHKNSNQGVVVLRTGPMIRYVVQKLPNVEDMAELFGG